MSLFCAACGLELEPGAALLVHPPRRRSRSPSIA